MAPDLTDPNKKKSREQWLKEGHGHFASLRSMIQEHGEIFFVLGVLFGIFFVFFYKLVVFILVIGILAGFAVWFTSPSEDEAAHGSRSDITKSNSPDGPS